MMCNICLEACSGHQWGIIPVNIGAIDREWVDVEDEVAFAVHRYCLNEAIECYTMELADGFLENEYMLERKNADKCDTRNRCNSMV